jgi:hypothetical protein
MSETSNTCPIASVQLHSSKALSVTRSCAYVWRVGRGVVPVGKLSEALPIILQLQYRHHRGGIALGRQAVLYVSKFERNILLRFKMDVHLCGLNCKL